MLTIKTPISPSTTLLERTAIADHNELRDLSERFSKNVVNKKKNGRLDEATFLFVFPRPLV